MRDHPSRPVLDLSTVDVGLFDALSQPLDPPQPPPPDQPEPPSTPTSPLPRTSSDRLLLLVEEEENVGEFDDPADHVRRQLALILIAVLAGTIFLSFGLLVYIAVSHQTDLWVAQKEWLGIVFGPLVTLVATVLGYYFGSKS